MATAGPIIPPHNATAKDRTVPFVEFRCSASRSLRSARVCASDIKKFLQKWHTVSKRAVLSLHNSHRDFNLTTSQKIVDYIKSYFKPEVGSALTFGVEQEFYLYAGESCWCKTLRSQVYVLIEFDNLKHLRGRDDPPSLG